MQYGTASGANVWTSQLVHTEFYHHHECLDEEVLDHWSSFSTLLRHLLKTQETPFFFPPKLPSCDTNWWCNCIKQPTRKVQVSRFWLQAIINVNSYCSCTHVELWVERRRANIHDKSTERGSLTTVWPHICFSGQPPAALLCFSWEESEGNNTVSAAQHVLCTYL